MNPRYEFLSIKHGKLIERSREKQLLRECGHNRLSMRARMLISIGDGMISCGSWLKRTSGSKLNQNTSKLLSQN